MHNGLEGYLYHATYKPLLDNIKKNGLGNTKRTNYEDSKPGVVYLAYDPEVAISYAEVAENVDEDWLDRIVLLEIPIDKLDESYLMDDENVLLEEGEIPETVEYHKIIPWSDISAVVEDL